MGLHVALKIARSTLTYLVLTTCLLLSGGPKAVGLPQRTHILIVGSSTAFPIVSAAAESMRRRGVLTTSPVVESTGSGGGIKLFCGGMGLRTPDITMTSRRMRSTERSICAGNGVNDIREVKIGYDGIVLANAKSLQRLRLSRRDLYLALAREVPAHGPGAGLVKNFYTSWQQVNPDLPDIPIRVFGPPPTSGTRDIFVERLLKPACLQVRELKLLHDTAPRAFNQQCYALREDGAFISAGENDARIVRKLIGDPQALGIFGYSFLDSNRDRLQAASVNGIEPLFELIESGIYPLSRPLYLYTKPGHERLVKELDVFVDVLLSAAFSGPEGLLIDHGLVPLPGVERAAPAN
jgi:phosphate transport system substrate-binding protein